MEIDYEWLKNELQLMLPNEEQKQVLRSIIEPMFVLPGIPIIHQGTAVSDLYLLRSGNVAVTRNINGRETTLTSGDYSKVFGEVSMFTDEPVSASVIAREACIVYKISSNHFQNLMHKNSELALKLLTFIVRNMSKVIRRLDTKKDHWVH